MMKRMRIKRVQAVFAICTILSMFFTGFAFAEPNVQYDVLIKNGVVIDGSGDARYNADIAIKDGKIAKIIMRDIPPGQNIADSKGKGNHYGWEKGNAPVPNRYKADRVIDAQGLVVAPGFMDIHTHQDGSPIERRTESLNFVKQGVTFVLGGHCGGGQYPVGEYLDYLEQKGIGINFGILVGQGDIRSIVIGNVDRLATPEEIEVMKSMVSRAMEEGALGMSTGLFYIPGCFTPTEEVIELAKVVAQYGGIYSSHMRDEASGIVDSIIETIRITEEAGLPGQISHIKLVGFPNWAKCDSIIAMIEEARARGVDITADQYAYDTSSTSIGSALIPAWAREGGQAQFLARLADPEIRQQIVEGVLYLLINERGGNNPANVRVSSCNWNRAYEGKTLADILVMNGQEPTLENAAELVIQIQVNGGAGGLFTMMDPANIEKLMQQPWVMVASDASTPSFGSGSPHPRTYGNNARVLSYYVRERGVITLEEAIRKMTSLPASRLGIDDRGLIKEGYWADIAIFNPDTIQDKATFTEPHQYAEGVEYVLMNGQIVIDEGEHTGILAGKVIRHTP